jgi:hypothetical protein
MHIIKLPSGKYINVSNISTVDRMTKKCRNSAGANYAQAFLRVHRPSIAPADYFGLYFEDLYDEDMMALAVELDRIAFVCARDIGA